jgi:hypothetical protein
MGEQGLIGVRGEKGDVGPMGERGEKGELGLRGERGEKGDVGPMGVGERGEKGDVGAMGERGEKGLQGERGEKGIDGDDGVSILSAVVDGEGDLVLTMSDGATRKAGVVRGKDGRNGVDGRAGEQGRDAIAIRLLPLIEDSKSYSAGVWALHAGGSWYSEKDTEPLKGRNPIDAGWTPIAVGEQKLDITFEDEGRVIVVTRTTSTGLTVTKRYTSPVVLDRGVFVASKTYARGDGVTRSGSYFIARADNPKGLPGASDDWRLAVKAGKDGKDG